MGIFNRGCFKDETGKTIGTKNVMYENFRKPQMFDF